MAKERNSLPNWHLRPGAFEMIKAEASQRRWAGNHIPTRILGVLCILAVLTMAFILSLLAAAIAPFDFCAAVIAGGAVCLWAISFRLARQHEEVGAVREPPLAEPGKKF